MAKYLISRYTPANTTIYIISRLKSYKIVDCGNKAYCVIDKIIYKDKRYRKSNMPKYYRQYLPHRTNNGVYRIVGFLDGSLSTLDEIHEFNSDDEAILWFELNVRGEVI